MNPMIIAGAAGLALAAGTAAIGQAATGKVHTRADVQAKIGQHFAKVDADRDGFVTRAEADSAVVARHGKAKDGAGRRPARLFERLDTDNDGQVTRAEADAAMAAMAARRAQRDATRDRGAGMFERLDTNRDGSVTRAEFDAAHAQHKAGGAAAHGKGMRGMRMSGFGGHMFAMADANKDGRVSLQEATAAALQHFDMADANRDGQLTPDERRQMRQRMKAGQHNS